ncbi:hypothetical protein M3Y99_01113300 [Aphelenchoides fujianensis]|nr:hypothetical protein M3Y99_01113300 [Aphelenchoides fujianensis]
MLATITEHVVLSEKTADGAENTPIARKLGSILRLTASSPPKKISNSVAENEILRSEMETLRSSIGTRSSGPSPL